MRRTNTRRRRFTTMRSSLRVRSWGTSKTAFSSLDLKTARDNLFWSWGAGGRIRLLQTGTNGPMGENKKGRQVRLPFVSALKLFSTAGNSLPR
jgi:hypothetical protein